MSSYQFTADDADTVLRATRCEVPREFRVHKIILSIASPVFKDMFGIPQPVPSTTPVGPAIPVIDVDDDPNDPETFLRMIYPFGPPATPTLDTISRALVTLDKYQVQGASLQPIRSLLVSHEFLKNDPIRVYSLACSSKFKEEADLAAPYTSSLDVFASACEEDIRRMTGMEYHRILTLSKQRRLRSQTHILNNPTTCSGCRNYKNFFYIFRSRLLENFNIDCGTFYDYGRCIARCFEIARRAEREVEFGCDMGQDSHLGAFIKNLAAKLNSPT